MRGQGYREAGTFVHSWWGCEMGWTLQKPIWQLLKKLKIELLQNISPNEMEGGSQRDICYEPVSIDGWTDEQNVSSPTTKYFIIQL